MAAGTNHYPDKNDLQTGDLVWPRHPDVRTLPTGELAVHLLRAVAGFYGVPVTGRLAYVETLLQAVDAAAALTGRWAADLIDDLAATLDPIGTGVIGMLQDFVLLYATQSWSLGEPFVGASQTLPLEADLRFPKWLRTKLDEATVLGIYVGHVGMIERDGGDVWVVESTYRLNGMRIVSYDRWVADRKKIDAYVWHGRVLDNGSPVTPPQAQEMLSLAHFLRMQGKQYAIFDHPVLGDLTYVYCSELVYLCAKQINIDLDSRSMLARSMPFLGPRALTRSPNVLMLNEPDGKRY